MGCAIAVHDNWGVENKRAVGSKWDLTVGTVVMDNDRYLSALTFLAISSVKNHVLRPHDKSWQYLGLY